MTRKFLSAFFTLLFLSACGSSHPLDGPDPLLPLPTANTGPSDAVLMATIKSYIKQTKGPAYSQFEYARPDLNGDGRRDALVLFKSPHKHWCGWTGCMMLALRADDTDFYLINEFDGIRGPLIISDLRTNGWRDLIIRTSSDKTADRNVILRSDGRRYPSNPAGQPAINRALPDIPGLRIFP